MFRAVFYIVFLAPILLKRSSAEDAMTADDESNRTEPPPGPTTPRTIARKWLPEIFSEVQSSFTMRSSVSEQCRNDYLLYETYKQNQTIWAIRMMESSEWPRLSLFSGATTALGDWSECLSVRAPTYRGQYCLIDSEYDFTFAPADSIIRGWDKPANQNASVWGQIKMYDKIITRTSRRKSTWALCVPSSCSAADLHTSLMNAALPVFQKYDLSFEASVAPATCVVEKSKHHSNTFWLTLCFLSLLSSIVLLATFVDYKRGTQSETKHPEEAERTYASEALYAFSIQKSWKFLTYSSPSTIRSLYFAKTILFWFILCLHEHILAITFPKIEQEKTELMFQPWSVVFGFHSAVDVFLAVSGFLRFHFGYGPTKKGGISYFFRSIVCRWIRLIPVMGLFILVYVFMVPELGDGPLWNKRMPYEVECCKSNWWTSMLAIQNMINRKDRCLPNTWYIAVDFQLTIVGAALLVILAKNFRLGILSMIVTHVMGILVHFYTIYVNKFTGLPLPAAFGIEVMRKLPIMSDLYIQMYSRIGPYMVGFIGALLMRELKIRKYQPSAVLSFSLVAGTTLVCVGAQLYGFLFTILNRPYDPIENALYGAFTRTMIAVPVICLIVTLELRPFRWTSYILQWKGFLVLGRLAFVMYLSSYPIQHLRYSSLRQVLIGTGHTEMAYGIMIDLCLTVIVSGYLFLFAEAPIHNLTVLIEKGKSWKMKQSLDANVPKELSIYQFPLDQI